MQLIKTLFANGFTLNDQGKDLRPEVHKLLDAGNDYNEALELLDEAVFYALYAIYPNNRLINELEQQYREEQAQINNDGFNTDVDDTPVVLPDQVEAIEQQPGKFVNLIRQATIDREQEPDPQLTLLSFGGGQDSWALLYKFIYDPDFRKKYAPKDLIVAMSDTGNEFPYTYLYVKLAKDLCDQHGIHFQFITNDQGYHTPGWMNLKDNMRRNKTILGAAMGVKACTPSLKIQVVDKYMYAYMCKLYGFEPRINKASWKDYKQKFGTRARVIIGFAKDEEARMAKSNKAHESLPKWKREHIQYVYPLLEEGWNRAAAQDIIRQYRGDDIPPPSNCMICFYQSDQEIVYLERHYPEEFYDWVELEKAKLEKHAALEVKKNYGVYGSITLLEKLAKAKEKYGHWTDEQLWEYKMSHGHCVKSTY
jgi:hypothetical protein